MTWQQAYDTCTTGDAVCDDVAAPTIELAIATVAGSGSVGSDGSVALAVNHTLVYVITQTGVPCQGVGGVTSSGASAAPVPPTACTLRNFVDATSGRVLLSTRDSD